MRFFTITVYEPRLWTLFNHIAPPCIPLLLQSLDLLCGLSLIIAPPWIPLLLQAMDLVCGLSLIIASPCIPLLLESMDLDCWTLLSEPSNYVKVLWLLKINISIYCHPFIFFHSLNIHSFSKFFTFLTHLNLLVSKFLSSDICRMRWAN